MKGSPLNKAVKGMRAPHEQVEYRRRIRKAVALTADARPSVGRITPKERKAIRKATTATRIITTRGEAQGVRKILKRKARKS